MPNEHMSNHSHEIEHTCVVINYMYRLDRLLVALAGWSCMRCIFQCIVHPCCLKSTVHEGGSLMRGFQDRNYYSFIFRNEQSSAIKMILAQDF